MLIWVLLGSEAQAQRPAIAILQPKGGEVFSVQDQHFPISVKVENVTSRSSVGLFLYRNVPEDEKKNSSGLQEGPLFETSIDLAEFKGHLTWAMKTLGCVRNGVTALCPANLLPGAYRLEAVLYNETKAPLLGKNSLKREQVLAEAISKEFKIYPTNVEGHLTERLFAAATKKFIKLSGVAPYPGLVPNLYSSVPVWPGADGLRCQKYPANFPFTGHVIACGSEDPKVDIRVGGKIESPPTITSYAKALELATDLVTKRYLSRVDYAEFPGIVSMSNPQILEQATYLDLSLVKWNHRLWWIFAFRTRKLGGKENGSDRFDDLVTVIVGNEGWSCILKITPYRTNAEIDLDHINKHCVGL